MGMLKPGPMSETPKSVSGDSVRFSTLAVHGGEERASGGTGTPIYRSSTYELEPGMAFDDIRYIRLNNTPSQSAVQNKLAALEGAEAALVTSSGTSAISIALDALLAPGDEVIAPLCIYGGTRKLLQHFSEHRDVVVHFVDEEDPAAWQAALSRRTKLFYAESLSNPWMRVGPLHEMVQFSQAHGLISVVDNTLLSPAFFRPLEFGFDLVVHSASKYLNGHADVVAGVVAGGGALVERIRKRANLLGGCLDPQACFLLGRGARTLPMRMAWQSESTRALAEYLSAHQWVDKVYYPGLSTAENAASYERAERWFGGAGAMLCFEPKGGPAVAQAVVEALRIPLQAPSLGGLETLVSRPVATSHAGLSKAVQRQMGVSGSMIRVAVGAEDVEDLKRDFAQALMHATGQHDSGDLETARHTTVDAARKRGEWEHE